MPEGNPLVAAPVETTTAVTGIGIAESATDLANGLSDGSWVEAGLGAGGVALETLSMVIDPLGTLASYGVGWLIEHVRPLKEALDWLAGDPPEIRAFSETWAAVSAEVGAVAQEYLTETAAGTAGWTGTAADAYRGHAARTSDALTGAAALADGISTGVAIMGEVVAAVRELVRELVAELVGRLIAWALEIAATLGFATPLVVQQATAAIARTAGTIATFIRKLVRTIANVTPLIRRVMTKLDEIMTRLAGLMRRADAPRTPGTVTARRTADDVPATTGPSGATTPSGGTAPPGTRTDPPPTARGADATTPSGTGTTTAPAGGRSGSQPGTGRAPSRPDNPATTATDVARRRCVNDPVDVATGEVVLHQTDLELPGVLPLVLTRTHVSSYRAGRGFGPSWSATLDQRVEHDAEGTVFVAEQGMLLVYPAAGESPVLPRQGPRWPLRRLPGGDHVIELPERGHRLRFAADHGGLTEIADRNGNRITFTRQGGLVTEVRHSAGYRVGVDRDGPRVTGLRLLGRDGDVRLTGYRYDGAGRLTDVVNSSGRALRFSYDRAGRLTRWVDRNGQWYGYAYDERGRCVRNDGEALAGSFTYRDRLTVLTDAHGDETWFHLDEAGHVVREVDPLGHATVTEWDRDDRPLTRTDPLGHTTRYTYDTVGNLIELERPDGVTITAAYNDRHLPTMIIDATGGVWRREYDERGNLTAVTDPAGAITQFDHDERGGLVAVTDPLGNTRRLETDAAGLAVAVTDPLGATTRYTRDVFGRVTQVTDAAGGVTRLGWTVEGALIARTLPDGATERWRHDGEGNVVEHVDALGQVTRTSYTVFDLPATSTAPDGTRLEFGYDQRLRLTSVTNAQGAVWRYEYDPAGNLVAETDFGGARLRYRHDAAGRLVERVNAAGETVTFGRDALGAVTEKRVGTGPAAATTTYAHDAAGRLLRATGPAAELVVERDELGRVLAETVDGRRVESAYDRAGRRVRRTTPAGTESTWEYDAAGRPVALHTAGQTVRFGYDEAGREVTRGLGTAAVLAQTWDANHRLATQAVTAADPAQAHRTRVVQRRRFDYRADGHLVGVEDDLAGVRRFDLDPVGRVTAVHGINWTERYAYDGNGAVTAAVWPAAPDGAEQGVRELTGTLITRAGDTHYEHDDQGRTVLRRRSTLSGRPLAWTYTWDAEDRLTGVVTPDGTHWRYGYDPLGRRVHKLRMSPDGQTVAERTDFTWDGTDLAEQVVTTTAGAHATSWDWSPGEPRALTQTERRSAADAPAEWVDERFYALVTDLVGTPTELVGADGALAWRGRATLWGVALPQPGGTAYCPLRFPGQYHDAETGHHYNYHRYYDPYRAGFDSPDPVGLAGGVNPYAYVANPNAIIDPLGLTPCAPGSRRAAFRQAKRDLGIPNHQQPDAVERVPMTRGDGSWILDANRQPIMTREYHYTRADGSQVVIQDHAAGHQFGEGGVGDQGPHFNVRPGENTRTGHVPGTEEHYPFGS